jgi:hypothetical protein
MQIGPVMAELNSENVMRFDRRARDEDGGPTRMNDTIPLHPARRLWGIVAKERCQEPFIASFAKEKGS